jgi:hypothetical protein
MRCEDVTPQLADYLAGALPDRARDEIREHLVECRACREETEGFADTWQRLEDIAAERPNSASMRARFDAMIEGYEHGRARARETTFGERLSAWFVRPREMQLLPVACAALLFLAAGVALGRQLSPAPPAPSDTQISTLREELHEMRQMVTLSLLQQQSASERLRGVSWSSQLDMPGSEVVTALLDALKHDQNVNVRLASIDALRRFAHQDIVRNGCIDALGQQSSPLVQIALIDFMVDLKERKSIAAIRRLSMDPMLNQAVRSRATLGLERLGAA